MKKLLMLVVLSLSALFSANGSSGILTLSSEGLFVSAELFDDEASLHGAAFGGDSALVDNLIEGGVSVDARSPISRETALHKAAESGDVGTIAMLVWHNAHLDAPDRDGETPLHKAADEGHGDAVRLLLACGADAYVKDEEGYGLLHRIAREGQQDLCEPLFQGMLMDKVFENAQASLGRLKCILLCFNRATLFPKDIQRYILRLSDPLSWDLICAAGSKANALDSFEVFVQKILQGARLLGKERCSELVTKCLGRIAEKACLATTPVVGDRLGQIPCAIAYSG